MDIESTIVAHPDHEEQKMNIYALWHFHDLEFMEDAKLIGIYSTEDYAKAAQMRASQQPGFAEFHAGFHIDKYQLDKDHWTEGFCRAT